MQPNACALQKIKNDMTPPSQPGVNFPSTESPRRHDLPPEILEIIGPAVQIGSLTGLSGLLAGAFAGIIRSTPPTLFALASGIQWFALGTSYSASRSFVLRKWGDEQVTSGERVSASAIGGGVAGTVGGLLRGPRNIIPGAIMFAILGATGQQLFNMADSRKSEVTESGTKSRSSFLDSKWSPMKVLTDSEYEKMLQEKLLRVNAEIALIDENIEALRAQEREAADISLSDPRADSK